MNEKSFGKMNAAIRQTNSQDVYFFYNCFQENKSYFVDPFVIMSFNEDLSSVEPLYVGRSKN